MFDKNKFDEALKKAIDKSPTVDEAAAAMQKLM
jgi:hypothetical protein